VEITCFVAIRRWVEEGRMAHLKRLLVLAQACHLEKGQQTKLAEVSIILPFAIYKPYLTSSTDSTKSTSRLVILIGVKQVY